MLKKDTTHNIINNFIDPVLFSSIRDTLTGDTFYWFYNDFVNYRPCEGYKFTNEIIKNSTLKNPIFINYLNMVKPVLEKIPHKKIYSVTFNLFIKTPTPQKYTINNHKKDAKIGILFANTCDGKIEIDNNFIEAKENKLVTFDSNAEYKIITSVKNKIFTYVVINYE